jgi:signal transduction histidine kinase
VDPNQLTQALLNLLLNALQAGTWRLDSIGAATDKGGGLRIYVSDDGHGMRRSIWKDLRPLFYNSAVAQV